VNGLGVLPLVAALLVAGCMPGSHSGGHAAEPETTTLRDAGPAGTLRLEQISASFSTGDLQVRVTPLEEPVLRLAAPDLAQRLRGLAAEYRRNGDHGGTLLMVTYTVSVPDQRFSPTDLRFSVGGRRLEVADIRPLTAGWGEERTRPRQAEAGIYLLAEPIDPFTAFRLDYGTVTSDAWQDVLPRLVAERSRRGESIPTQHR
jgi:hypothetical protein